MLRCHSPYVKVALSFSPEDLLPWQQPAGEPQRHRRCRRSRHCGGSVAPAREKPTLFWVEVGGYCRFRRWIVEMQVCWHIDVARCGRAVRQTSATLQCARLIQNELDTRTQYIQPVLFHAGENSCSCTNPSDLATSTAGVDCCDAHAVLQHDD